MELYDGKIHRGVLYTIVEIMKKFGVRDKRAVKKWLDNLGVPWIMGPKNVECYLGDDILIAIAEATASCDPKSDCMTWPRPEPLNFVVVPAVRATAVVNR